MRLDRFLCQMNMGSRSDVKLLVRRGQVTVNGVVASVPEQKIDEASDVIACGGKVLHYKPYAYYMMNKPQGVVSATTDRSEKTVLELLKPFLPECDQKRALVPVGRLDKDTEGLLLFTDDGAMVHSLLSPKKHVNKTYHAKIAKPLSEADILALEEGVDISGTEPDMRRTVQDPKKTLPARIAVLEERLVSITIHEGRFHQVKRMLQAVDNEVISLKRERFGALALPPSLAPGECRELTAEEEQFLKYTVFNHMDAKQKTSALMEGIEAVIFDLDGTLIDSMGMWHEIDIEYLGKFGIPVPEHIQENIEGMSFHETAVYFKERFQISDDLETIEADWNEMAGEKYERELPLKSGAREFLNDCKKRGIRMGIATSNSRKLVDRFLKGHGLDGYFASIRTGCEGLRGKPAPDIYLAAAAELDIRPEHCLVFEDILPGIMAGKNAGMRVCAVEDAYSMDIRTQKMELADGFITDFAEIAFV